jgi:hypothetical protein
MAISQGILFSEPSIAETGVWCELNPGIDPAQWAYLCRYLGTRNSDEFQKLQDKILPNPDSVMSRLKRVFRFQPCEVVGVPLVCMGQSGQNYAG